MSENKKKNIFAEDSNESAIPLDKLLAEMKETSTANTTKTDIEKTNTLSKKEEKKELSPLEQLKLEKEKTNGGMIVSNDDLEKGMVQAPTRNIVYNDDRLENFQKAQDELDNSLRKRNAVKVLVQPQNEIEYVQLISEIDSIVFDENGKARFTLVDDEGNPVEPKFCKIREDNDEVFDFSVLSEYEQKQIASKDNTDVENKTSDDNNEKPEEISEEKKKIVRVLIDKTGLGTDFMFTDEEKEKLVEAETIRVNEVKVLDINAIRAKRNDKSFQDVIKEYNMTGSRATICFPASGFKAQMKGLTYGEYADIQLSMENVTFDQYMKRLSIIYNKMTNISTGPFKDFEDFLKRFAYTDIPLAIYGLFIATEAENQEIALRCGNQECNKNFNWKYTSRSVLRLDRCADTFLAKMEKIASAPAQEYDKIQAESVVMNSKVMELPDSKFVVEMGIASSYDFVYNFIPVLNEETFKEAFGNDINAIYQDNILLLTSVRSVYVPDGEGGYVECTGYKDILDALYNISPKEIQILAAYTAKIQSDYEITFSFGNVTCPHCKNVTQNLDISIDDLVFQTYQRLTSTEIDLSQIQDF